MGRLSEWAEKNKAGGSVQLAKKAERAETRENLKADFAATRAGFADTKAAKGESFEGVELKLGQVMYKGTGGPVVGATARVESGADAHRRITATRFLLAGGVFSKRKQVGHVYLTVEAPGYTFAVEVPAKKEADARSFAAKINNAAKRAG
jgi:hypothetical protein